MRHRSTFRAGPRSRSISFTRPCLDGRAAPSRGPNLAWIWPLSSTIPRAAAPNMNVFAFVLGEHVDRHAVDRDVLQFAANAFM